MELRSSICFTIIQAFHIDVGSISDNTSAKLTISSVTPRTVGFQGLLSLFCNKSTAGSRLMLRSNYDGDIQTHDTEGNKNNFFKHWWW